MRNAVAHLGSACAFAKFAPARRQRQHARARALPIPIVALCVSFVAVKAFAVQVETNSTASKNVALVESESPFSFEFHIEETYVGQGDVERGSLSVRDFDVSDTKVHFVLTPRVKIGVLRLGIQAERYSFSFGGNAAIPDVLESTNLVLGLDTEFSDSFLIRFEAQPGFYGTDFDDFGQDTFNVPVVIGGTYIFNSGFQIIFGVGIDALRQYPVLPGGGIRWKFAPQWTLNAVVPTPRLEYELNNSFTLYGGADIRSTSYRVDKQFGTLRGNPDLNHAAITYNEIRAGAGFEWKLTSAIKLSVEGGYIPFREFDFHRTEVRYHQDGGAPYAMLALHVAF
jgi:opacity protein-like surface antigen